ncbi:IS1 family transposase [Puia dinghuensis]|uniref:IS1 family transposase n=1 Tax=Puia dinghuensis TaxID=1792502 RepID=UPI0016680CB4|nr:IS1 family transposase [Puia dinghuensis]
MDCVNCQGKCWRSGRQKNGSQRYYCPACRKFQQARYQYKAYSASTDSQIRSLVCESVCIRGIARVLGIARGTVLDRIRGLAAIITSPACQSDQISLEVDELWTYINRKDNEYWVAYAINRGNSVVVDFVVGKRTKATLKQLIDRLLSLKPKTIRTDKLTLYERLIPKRLHRAGSTCINRIERKNLTIRTHLKRLSPRTICFSRSLLMLESCLRIYFWG